LDSANYRQAAFPVRKQTTTMNNFKVRVLLGILDYAISASRISKQLRQPAHLDVIYENELATNIYKRPMVNYIAIRLIESSSQVSFR
jgi:hypothetical protein